jgi:hypothetical protein
MLCSLVITVKENNLKIFDYLVYLFKRIPFGGFSDASDWAYQMHWSITSWISESYLSTIIK